MHVCTSTHAGKDKDETSHAGSSFCTNKEMTPIANAVSTPKVHKPSARQWHDHARSLTSNQTLQKPLVPKTPLIPRLTTSGNKTVTQRTVKHDANRSKIFSVSCGHQYHYPQHGKSVLLSERSIVNRAHTKMYRPLSSTQAVHRSQRYWNRLQHKRLSTRPIKQRALIRKWFDHWQTFCLF